MSILILSYETDVHYQRVKQVLDERGHNYSLFSGNMFPDKAAVGIEIKPTHQNLLIETHSGLIHSKAIHAVWNRRLLFASATQQQDRALRRCVEEESNAMLQALYPMLSHCSWLSSPYAVEIASSKPYQLQLAQALGFQIPPSYFGNHIETATAFVKQYDTLCLKPIKSTFKQSKPIWRRWWGYLQNKGRRYMMIDNDPLNIIDTSVDEYFVYATAMSQKDTLAQLHLLQNCPMIIQPYVPKAFELRITVVGQQVFACAIHSQVSEKTRQDWRNYDLENTPHKPFTLPDPLQKKCVALLRQMQLQFGCIDMIVTPEGEYYFLEINPNGQWLWIEEMTGMPIAEAIADWLIAPTEMST